MLRAALIGSEGASQARLFSALQCCSLAGEVCRRQSSRSQALQLGGRERCRAAEVALPPPPPGRAGRAWCAMVPGLPPAGCRLWACRA